MSDSPALPENLAPVAALVGTWTGTGTGEYPTIDAFEYREELSFTVTPKPFLAYSQRTWAPDGSPLHVETGYLRVAAGDRVELVLAQPTGQVELAEGVVRADGAALVLELDARVMNSDSAKTVDATRREYRLEGETLSTAFDMAAVGQPMHRHLRSTLSRF